MAPRVYVLGMGPFQITQSANTAAYGNFEEFLGVGLIIGVLVSLEKAAKTAADDHTLLLEAFRGLLEPEFEVVGAVADG